MNLYPYRSKMAAFILNFIPGLGHFYMGRRVRGVLYPMLFFGGILAGFMIAVTFRQKDFFFGFTLLCGVILWVVCMLDLFVHLLRIPPNRGEAPFDQYGNPVAGVHTTGYGMYGHANAAGSGEGHDGFGPSSHQYMPRQLPSYSVASPESERFFTILLSFIPGLGHLHMGLMQRGLSFLITFFGLGTIMFFLAGLTSHSFFLLFLGVLPVIWLYCMFDAVQLIHRKQAGEVVDDRTLFDDMESGREGGRRSKVMATLLSAFPGAGHMYLGLQKRGLQLMVIFLGSVYILDVLRLSLFMFLIPLIWFFAFFDGMQQTSRYGREPLIDRPVIEGIMDHRHWLGIGLLLLGLYYIVSNLIVPVLDIRFPEFRIDYRYTQYLKTAIVSLLLIAGGIKLMNGSKKKGTGKGKKYGDL